MTRLRLPLLIVVFAMAFSSSPAHVQGHAPRPSGIDRSTFDTAVRPQDDFFRHVNGGWLARTPIPADKSGYGSFDMLQDSVRVNLRPLLEHAGRDAAAMEPWARQVGDLYASFMNEAAIERAGVQPLAAELAAIDAIRTRDDLSRVLARLSAIGVRTPLTATVGPEPEHPEVYALTIRQGGLGMPNRDYYLNDGAEFSRYREGYATYLSSLLKQAGVERPDAEARQVLAFETDLAKTHASAVETRDQTKAYNPIAATDLAARYPGHHWPLWLATLGAAKPGNVVVAQPGAVAAASAAVSGWPLASWTSYLRGALLDTFAPYLSTPFVDAQFNFRGKVLNGQQENTARWIRAANAVDATLGESLGRLYVERHFTPDAKQKMEALIENLRSAFRIAIDESSWMQPATKAEAQLKLQKFRANVGYPEKWRDYSQVSVTRDGLAANMVSGARVRVARGIDRIGGPVDVTEWTMTPPTVNAQYNARLNAIFFPAGILQPPFFDPAADEAVNYGAIGAVIGHEMGHGFDDQGRKSDSAGRLRDWWTAEDAARYEKLAGQIAEQFSGYEALPGLHVNGKLTLGENIGDLTGLTIALRAYRLSLGGKPAPVIDGMTGEQRFFIGWAQAFRGQLREGALRALVISNPHSPERFRVNGAVLNVPAFYEAFGVKEGDRMWVPPAGRTLIW